MGLHWSVNNCRNYPSGGIWSQCSWSLGKRNFETPEPSTMLNNHTVLLLAGTQSSFDKYDHDFRNFSSNTAPVITIGAGRVGRETCQNAARNECAFNVLLKPIKRKQEWSITPSLAMLLKKAVLERAGINKAPAVVITSHNDESNMYLTIYCLKLRPDIQIVSRAFLHRNVNPLHLCRCRLCHVTGIDAGKHHFQSSQPG